MEINNEFDRDAVYIDLKTLFNAVISKLRLVVMVTVIITLIAAFASIFLLQKRYSATVRFYVSNNKDIISQNIDSSDIDASTKLVPSYVELLKSKAVIAGVIEDSKLNCTVEQIIPMLKVTAVTDTQMLILNVVCNNPDDAHIIANAIADIAPSKITEIMNGSIIKVVDYADKPTEPSSPNVLKNILIGFILGLFLGAAAAVLIELNDSTIKSEEDIKGIFPDIPVIGIIPNISVENIE